jgi:hypothetical protein
MGDPARHPASTSSDTCEPPLRSQSTAKPRRSECADMPGVRSTSFCRARFCTPNTSGEGGWTLRQRASHASARRSSTLTRCEAFLLMRTLTSPLSESTSAHTNLLASPTLMPEDQSRLTSAPARAESTRSASAVGWGGSAGFGAHTCAGVEVALGRVLDPAAEGAQRPVDLAGGVGAEQLGQLVPGRSAQPQGQLAVEPLQPPAILRQGPGRQVLGPPLQRISARPGTSGPVAGPVAGPSMSFSCTVMTTSRSCLWQVFRCRLCL